LLISSSLGVIRWSDNFSQTFRYSERATRIPLKMEAIFYMKLKRY
jgi:hypothetical protein